MKIMNKKMIKNGMATLCMLCAAAAPLVSCQQDDTVTLPGDTATLRIASVTIDGQQPMTRAAYEGEVAHDKTYNRSITGFTSGDELYINCQFVSGSILTGIATYDGSAWSIVDNNGAPIAPGEGQSWEEFDMEIINMRQYMSGDRIDASMGIVQGDILGDDETAEKNIQVINDCLKADINDGTITIDTDPMSPTIGTATINLKHENALFRLPESAASVTTTVTYLKDGKDYTVTGLATLWAVVVRYDGVNFYHPLTKVTVGGTDYWQAFSMAYGYTLTGFKAVLYTEESGELGDANFNNNETLTIDLPFKQNGQTFDEGFELQENGLYPLTLSISPETQSVNLSTPNQKPNWGEETPLNPSN